MYVPDAAGASPLCRPRGDRQHDNHHDSQADGGRGYSPEEDDKRDAGSRRRMGLRPLYYAEYGKHPDDSPCPLGAGWGKHTVSTTTSSMQSTC